MLLFLGLLCGAPLSAATAARPNIIIVMPDDVGYGDFGCLGNPIVKTPALDAFWKQSVRFTDFHVSPTCAPTRAALLTGRHEFKNGVTHTILERERLTLKATTFAQVLQRAGYATGIFGKWHLGDEAKYRPERRGFDEVFIHGGGGIGQTYPGSCGDAPDNLYFDPAILHNGKFEKTKGYCTDLFFQQALRWIDTKRSVGQPFFAFVTPNAAHAPLQCPTNYFQRHAGKVSDMAAKFYGMVENIDDNFGTLVGQLKAWGLEENTLVIFLTDNGGTVGVNIFNAGMRGGKGTPYEGATRVPSFWRWPDGFRGGADCAALTAHLDVFPTLAEITGVKLNARTRRQVEGRSLLPLLKNPEAEWPDRFLVTHVGRWPRGQVASAKFAPCSIRDRQFSLVNNTELYDLHADPGQKTNVLMNHPGVVTKLRAAYEKWWGEVQPLLVNENVTGPKANPFKELYWKQFGGGPDAALIKLMDPAQTSFKEGGASGPARKKAAAPNILFIIADQWRAQAFGFAGDPNVKTPHLDRFERQCVNFTQAVAGMPVCSPTRASLLTGQRPQTHGIFVNDVPLSTNAVTLPKVLKAAGYDTGCIGKWHIDGHGSRSAFIPRERRQGFDYWKVLECTHAYNNSPYYADGPEKLKWEGYDAIAQTRDAQAYLRDRAQTNKPFLLWLAWGPPHNPYETAPAKYRAMYAPEKIKLHPNVPPTAQAQARKELAGYYAHCSALDDCFADLLRTLDETGLATNTIVVFTSDHGDMLWSQEQQRKQRPWEESARVPMLFRMPASLSIPPQRLAATINTEDVMPTLLGLCGQFIPKSVEGFDFTGAMRGGADPSGGATILRCITPFGEFIRARGGREYRAVRTAQHTYVRDLNGPWLLYDNDADPYQLRNLAGQSAHANLQSKLEALLRRKLAEQRDDFRPGATYLQQWGYTVDATGTVPYLP